MQQPSDYVIRPVWWVDPKTGHAAPATSASRPQFSAGGRALIDLHTQHGIVYGVPLHHLWHREASDTRTRLSAGQVERLVPLVPEISDVWWVLTLAQPYASAVCEFGAEIIPSSVHSDPFCAEVRGGPPEHVAIIATARGEGKMARASDEQTWEAYQSAGLVPSDLQIDDLPFGVVLGAASFERTLEGSQLQRAKRLNKWGCSPSRRRMWWGFSEGRLLECPIKVSAGRPGIGTPLAIPDVRTALFSQLPLRRFRGKSAARTAA